MTVMTLLASTLARIVTRMARTLLTLKSNQMSQMSRLFYASRSDSSQNKTSIHF